jgi:outer membrane receptor protein involved in Fe transport
VIKRALPAVFGLLTLCLPVAAQDETITREELRITGALDAASALTLYRPDIFRTVNGSVLIHGLPVLILLDGRRLPVSSALGRMGMAPLDLFPVALLSAVEVQKINASPMYGTDSPGGVVNLHLNRDYYGGWGEVGVFYGRSSGKFNLEDKQAYFIGGVGDERFQITAGAVYQESKGRFLRLGPTPPN